jgi:methionyl-tRNA synthetase
LDGSFYITTPIYYVNGRPHIGHGYTTIVADVISRYHKLMGVDSFFLTGTDEHGSSVEKAATASGVTPRKFVDEFSQYFKDSWKALRIENDHFIRTTDEKHESAFQKFVAKLRETKTPDGLTAIYEGEYKGLYCVGCEKFMTEKELDENGECPVHLKKPDVVTEKNYFFRLTAYLDQVRDLIESDKFKILPLERKKEVLGLFKQGLDDFSISREKVRWGIPLPFDTEQMAYVWVDALSNYITAIGYSADKQMFDKWWNKSRIVHLIGKDILKFHAVYWPAMLLAAGLRTPDTLFVHGYFTIDGQKMSKSLGNVIANEDLVRDFGADGARYLLVNMFPFGTDGDIRVEDFYRRYNSDLANDFGNLVSRSVKLTRSNFNGKIPDAAEFEASERDLDKTLKIQLGRCKDAAESINPNSAAEAFMTVCRELNRYFDSQKPWQLAKDKKTERLATVLRTTLEGIRCVSILAYPFMPDKCRQLRELLGVDPVPGSLDEAGNLHGLVEGTELRAEGALFPRLEIPKTGTPSPAEAREDNLISIDEFAKVELRVAEVLEAENVPKTDRLLKLQITTGEDRRQIVAGIAQYYTPDELVGKKIIVVTNLKPAKLRGIESNGMLLAAKKKDKLSLLTVDSDLPPGAKIS